MRKGYLLDTCVLSEFARKQPHPAVTDWLDAQCEDDLYLSVLSLGELQKGVAKLPEGPRRTMLQDWVARDLAERFRLRLLPVDESVARTWGEISGQAEACGEKLPVIDSLLAATALQYGLVVVTRDTKHLERSGVPVLNPWT